MELVIAEKPSVGKDIARVLGAKDRHDGYPECKYFKSNIEISEKNRNKMATFF